MRDPEFIELRNRFLIGLVVSLLFTVPIFLIFYNRITPNSSKIMNKIKKEESFFLLVTEKNCKSCTKYHNLLKKIDIQYEEMNKNKDKNYQDTLKLLEIAESDVEIPCLIYIEKGVLISSLPNIQSEEELNTFISYYVGGSNS